MDVCRVSTPMSRRAALLECSGVSVREGEREEGKEGER